LIPKCTYTVFKSECSQFKNNVLEYFSLCINEQRTFEKILSISITPTFKYLSLKCRQHSKSEQEHQAGDVQGSCQGTVCQKDIMNRTSADFLPQRAMPTKRIKRKSIVKMTSLKSTDETAFWCAGTMKIGCAHERLDFFQIAIAPHKKEPLSCGGLLAALSVTVQYWNDPIWYSQGLNQLKGLSSSE